ncbi:MAG: NAD(P)/FAD-dependent oxidoreductase [Pseudomonadota bacterium]
MKSFDVVVIGAGAAGMMCASVAGQRGKRVLLVDHATRLAEKIRISGGGRCNFTNVNTSPAQFFSANPAFCRSALSQYSAKDFIDLVKRHRIDFHEKHKGQLFCDDSSQAIIRMLEQECEAGSVKWQMPCKVISLQQEEKGFRIELEGGAVKADRVVIATGGMAIPQIGATDWGLKCAKTFGIPIIEPRPALVPLTFESESWAAFSQLAGIALEVDVQCENGKERALFKEDLLFTHRGLSGPAILQISTVWKPGASIKLNLSPDHRLDELLVQEKKTSRQHLNNVLCAWLPKRLAHEWLLTARPDLKDSSDRKLAEVSDKTLRQLADSLQHWNLVPKGSEGYKKAEVMRGGVDTKALHQHSMEAKTVPGLHFIGEVVDVTGWLGGYNFQWAWSSAVAAGRAV